MMFPDPGMSQGKQRSLQSMGLEMIKIERIVIQYNQIIHGLDKNVHVHSKINYYKSINVGDYFI